MMSNQLPRLFFVGAGNIAQSIIKGIIKAQPSTASQILATAPTLKNLNVVSRTLGCQTTLLIDAQERLIEFEPDFVFLCVKPQVLMNSLASRADDDLLLNLLKIVPKDCPTLSLLAGVKSETFSAFNIASKDIVRVMLNTAAEIGSTSVLYRAHPEMDEEKLLKLEQLFRLVGQAVVRIGDENLMDVATGICGSGIAFFYEMIQTISDIGVKNGLGRSDSLLVAAQLSKSAGEMILNKRLHPYQLRDEVTSPGGTTIYGLSSWHEGSTNQKIGQSFQASIDRARQLSAISESKLTRK